MKKLHISFYLIMISLSNSFSQLTTTVNPSIADLTNYFQGIGLTITNLSVTASPNSYGFFSGSSSMAFGSGIIMSTGKIDSISNPAAFFLSTSFGTSLPTTQLTSICPSCTHDLCMIDFDCVPIHQNLLFSYSFGSEEYNEFVGSNYNDAFGIFITGPNPAGGNFSNVNIASMPGSTNLVTSVNSINNGSSGAGPCYNCAYFIDNTNGTSVAFDGFTTGLQGLVQVTPSQTYHFRIAIADASDGIFDSSVMFLTNSFKSVATTDLPMITKEQEILIYPNPSSGSVLHMNIKDEILKTIELFSYQGKRIENIQFDKNKNTLLLNDITPGIYFLHITTGNGKTVKKLIIE